MEMSAERPSRIGRFVKWFVVPIALAALGVFGIGPFLNRVNLPIVDKIKPKPSTEIVREEVDAPDQNTFGEPEVEVTVSPSSRRKPRRGALDSGIRHRRKRSKKRPTPIPETTTGDIAAVQTTLS